MSLVLTTASVPDGEKLAYWNAAVSRTFVPLNVRPREPGPFSGRITTDHLGYLQVSTVEADAERVTRTPKLIARTPGHFVSVGVQAAGAAELAQDGRSAELKPGELVLYDTSRPYTLDQSERFRMHVFQLPRRMLGIPQDDVRQVTGQTIRPESGVAAMLAPFLTSLAAVAPSCAPAVAEQLAGNVADLLATLITERSGGPERPVAEPTMTLRIRGYVNRNLADPDLSPETIAAHHHISVRYLHKLFAGEEVTISRWIQRRRLEECGRELGRHGRANPTVSAVAQRWGFVNAAHFSRAFRSAYGMSPTVWRNGRTAFASAAGPVLEES